MQVCLSGRYLDLRVSATGTQGRRHCVSGTAVRLPWGEVKTLSELGRRQALPVRAWGGRHYTLHPAEPSVGLPVFIKGREWSGKSKGSRALSSCVCVVSYQIWVWVTPLESLASV